MNKNTKTHPRVIVALAEDIARRSVLERLPVHDRGLHLPLVQVEVEAFVRPCEAQQNARRSK